MDDYKSTDEVAAENNVPRTRIDRIVRDEKLKPAVAPAGSGKAMRFDVIDRVAVKAYLTLKDSGYNGEVAGMLCKAVQKFDLEELLEAFARGETCMMFLPAKMSVYPGLLPPEAIHNHETLKMAHVSGILPCGLDLKRLYDQLMKESRKNSANSN